MTQRIRVVQFGLGPIGQALAAEALAREDLELVGGVDRAPELAGCRLEDLLGPQAHGLPRVVPNLGDLSMPAPPRVVLHATGSRLPSVLPELEEISSGRKSLMFFTHRLANGELRDVEVHDLTASPTAERFELATPSARSTSFCTDLPS